MYLPYGQCMADYLEVIRKLCMLSLSYTYMQTETLFVLDQCIRSVAIPVCIHVCTCTLFLCAYMYVHVHYSCVHTCTYMYITVSHECVIVYTLKVHDLSIQ